MTREARLEEALRRIAEPDQEPLRAALRMNDELRIIEAVTRALNWCRDEAKRALLSEQPGAEAGLRPVVVDIDPADIAAVYAHDCDHPKECPVCRERHRKARA